MTDNEIIEILTVCITSEDCSLCPMFRNCPTSFEVQKQALDLINRQKAEIEKLEKGSLKEAMTFNSKTIANIRAEAVKEVVSKVNEAITEIYNRHIFGSNDLEDEEKDAIINFSDDVTSEVNIILKEMAGADNA